MKSFRSIASAILLVCIVEFSSGAACFIKKPAATPAAQADAVQTSRERGIKTANAITDGLSFAIVARRQAETAYKAGLLTAARMDQIDRDAITLSNVANVAIPVLKAATSNQTILESAADVLKAFGVFTTSLNFGDAMAATIEDIKAKLATIKLFSGVK